MNVASADRFYGAVDPAGLKKLVAGWVTESTGAFAAVVLSILGLAGIIPATLGAIAAITLGAGLLAEAAALGSCFSGLFAEISEGGQRLEWGGAVAGKVLGGMVGIVVGALVLLGTVAPNVLPVAILGFGAASLFTSMVSLTPGTQEIVGACTFVLGLLAISGIHTLTLVLVALLGLGLMALFNGALSERSLSTLVVNRAPQ